ncbi:MAG TPA: hypothetical protein VIC62_07720 [Nakamurella sp.]
MPPDRRTRRFTQLLAGLLLYGFTMGLMVRAVLGLDPWDVFHQGLTALVNRWLPLSYGAVITIVSGLVLLLWIPLRQRPGVGTIANAAIIGFAVDVTLWLIPPVDDLTVRIVLLVASVAGNALAGALYIGAGLGPGPRDGLMTGLVARGVGSVRVVRTVIEVTVLAIGWMFGGIVGVGTVVYAVAIGPLLHVLLPKLQVSAVTEEQLEPVRVPADEIVEAAQAPCGEGEGR